MEMQDRIHYNAEELIHATEAALDRLKIFQYEPRYQELLGESLINKILFWDKSIRLQKNNPFTLVVCGEFKRGKSTLINALLGEEVVTTNVTTETVTLNRISYGPHTNEAILSGGRRMALKDEEIRKDRLEEIIRQSPEAITQLELHRPIEILRKVTIIDTPGLNDSLRDFSSLVETALQQADAVLYLCSVDVPLSQDEQLFLRTMIVPQKYTDLFIIANFADMLRKADTARFQTFMNQRIASIIPNQKVILLSAFDELCRMNNAERPNGQLEEFLGSNFNVFRCDLKDLVQAKQGSMIPDRIHRLTFGMKEDLFRELEAIETGLELDIQQARSKVNAAQEEWMQQAREQERMKERLRADIRNMQKEAAAWVSELLDQMGDEVNDLSDIPAEELSKYYSIYCIDIIQEAINRCVEYHMEQIYERLDSISIEAVRGFTRPEGVQDYGFRFALNNKTWTAGDNVGYVASKFSQLGLLSVVVDGIAGSMRQKETANRTPQILAAIKKQYPIFTQSATDSIRDIYEKLTEAVSSQLTDYFNSALEDEKRQNEQMSYVAQQTEEKKKEIRDAVTQLRCVLEQF